MPRFSASGIGIYSDCDEEGMHERRPAPSARLGERSRAPTVEAREWSVTPTTTGPHERG